MANRRAKGLVHVGAWVDEELEEKVRVIAHLRLSDKASVLTEILRREVASELKRFPPALRKAVVAALRAKRRNGKRRIATQDFKGAGTDMD